MVSPSDVISIYSLLSRHAIRVWLTGGWGIDALLGEHTRPHKDLDLIMLVDDVIHMRELLNGAGYELKELWSENLWTIDAHWINTATAFVLRHPDGREIDAHAMRLNDQGYGLPAWDKYAGFIFTPQDLAGTGTVGGCPVQCMSADNQMICHTGYQLPDYQWDDLERLQAKFGIAFPAELSSQRMERSS